MASTASCPRPGVIAGLKVDGVRSGAMAISSRCPRLSWHYQDQPAGFRQKSYRITAVSDDGSPLWDSGVVESASSLNIPWGGAPLASRQQVTWRVEAWGTRGEELRSEAAFFETPLLDQNDWKGRWIHYEGNNPAISSPIPFFRHVFRVEPGVKRARLYLAARGLAKASCNGLPVGRDFLAPGWTDFHKEIQYLTYDVTSLLRSGENVLGVKLGDGWYCGLFSGRKRNRYGNVAELLVQLEWVDAEDKIHTECTDHSWRCATGPILASSIYDGEEYDGRLEMPGWDNSGFDDSAWKNAAAGEAGAAGPELVPKCCLPVRVVKELKPVAVLRPASDVMIWDFGQNFAGVPKIVFHGCGSQLFTVRFAEMLTQEGQLYTCNYRSAKSIDYFVTGAREDEPWSPEFTYHGFRYMQIDGWQFGASGKLPEVSALVLQSDMNEVGSFSCSHPKLNRLYENVVWGQRSNFVEIPTDCPQRDERMGWTGDAEVFCATASCNMDVAAFFRKYLRDIREAQRADGGVANIAPDIWHSVFDGAGWSDASVIIPWTMYRRYGDTRFLTENYAMMKAWVEYQHRSAPEGLRPKVAYGDWLAPDPTPVELVATAYYAYTARLLSLTAGVLGNGEDEARYRALSEEVAAAFRRAYVKEDGSTTPDTQTACVLALHFDLLLPGDRAKTAAHLQQLIRANGNRLSTGFVGTAYLNLALSENGLNGTACDLWMQEEYPSWLFPVNQGATTMWERWNSYTVKDGFGSATMNSFNHYAYGAVHEWVVAYMAGIRYREPGGTSLLFAAEPDPRLTHLDFTLETPCGRAESHWRYEGGKLLWSVTAPPNTRMTVQLPAGYTADRPAGELPCGTYEFVLEKEGK